MHGWRNSAQVLDKAPDDLWAGSWRSYEVLECPEQRSWASSWICGLSMVVRRPAWSHICGLSMVVTPPGVSPPCLARRCAWSHSERA